MGATSQRRSRNVKILPQITVSFASDEVHVVIPGIGTASLALAHRIVARVLVSTDLWDEQTAAGAPVVHRERFCVVVRVRAGDADHATALEAAAAAESSRTHRVVRK